MKQVVGPIKRDFSRRLQVDSRPETIEVILSSATRENFRQSSFGRRSALTKFVGGSDSDEMRCTNDKQTSTRDWIWIDANWLRFVDVGRRNLPFLAADQLHQLAPF